MRSRPSRCASMAAALATDQRSSSPGRASGTNAICRHHPLISSWAAVGLEGRCVHWPPLVTRCPASSQPRVFTDRLAPVCPPARGFGRCATKISFALANDTCRRALRTQPQSWAGVAFRMSSSHECAKRSSMQSIVCVPPDPFCSASIPPTGTRGAEIRAPSKAARDIWAEPLVRCAVSVGPRAKLPASCRTLDSYTASRTWKSRISREE